MDVQTLITTAHQQHSEQEPQVNSPFLRKLPAELRLLVYEEILRSWKWTDGIHIVQAPPSDGRGLRLTAFPCDCDSDTIAELEAHGDDTDYFLARWQCRPWMYSYSKTESPLALFLTCRQIYSEAGLLLYSSGAFDLATLETAMQFFSTTPPAHLNAITEIKVSGMSASDVQEVYDDHPGNDLEPYSQAVRRDWCILYQELAKMEALRRLTLIVPAVALRDEGYGGVMGRITDIKQVPRSDFKIVVPLSTRDDLNFLDADQAPFVIRTLERWRFRRWQASITIDRAIETGGRRRKALWKRVLLYPIYALFVLGEAAVGRFKRLKPGRIFQHDTDEVT